MFCADGFCSAGFFGSLLLSDGFCAAAKPMPPAMSSGTAAVCNRRFRMAGLRTMGLGGENAGAPGTLHGKFAEKCVPRTRRSASFEASAVILRCERSEPRRTALVPQDDARPLMPARLHDVAPDRG